jgi:MYXO-CTERM domain-containing protein
MSLPVTLFVGMEAPMRGNGGDDEAMACTVGGERSPVSLLLLLLLGVVRRRR